MEPIFRNYQSEEDYWRIRNFLREVFLQNDRRMLSWPVARWDYWRWHGVLNMGDGSLETGVFLWETEDCQLAPGSSHHYEPRHPHKSIERVGVISQ